MSRKPRINYNGALYHVIVRGNNRAYIFKSGENKEENDFIIISSMEIDKNVKL